MSTAVERIIRRNEKLEAQDKKMREGITVIANSLEFVIVAIPEGLKKGMWQAVKELRALLK